MVGLRLCRRIGFPDHQVHHAVGADPPPRRPCQLLHAAADSGHFLVVLAGNEHGVHFLHGEARAALRAAGADQERTRCRLRIGFAVAHLEVLPIEAEGALGPQALDHLDPFRRQIVALVVPDVVAPGVHLVELVLVGAGDDIEAGATSAHLIQGGDHLGGDRRVLQQRVHRGPDLYTLGHCRQRSHQDLGIERIAPVLGDATVAAPLGHRHDEVQAHFLRQQGRLTVVFIGPVEARRIGGEDPATVGDGQEHAEVLAAPVRRQAERASLGFRRQGIRGLRRRLCFGFSHGHGNR